MTQSDANTIGWCIDNITRVDFFEKRKLESYA